MPRTYKSKKGVQDRRNYDPEILKKAVRDIQCGKLTYRKASDLYGIPRSTLQNKVQKMHPKKLGGQTVLNEQEEKMLKQGILRAAHWGFPFTKLDIRYLVKGYLDKSGRKERKFPNNLPGEGWVHLFLKRHSQDLSVRLSENIKRARAEVNKETVKMYFSNIQPTLENVPPSNIINYDETNMSDDPGKQHIITKRGSKHAEKVMDSSKTSVSIMMAASADGKLLPPYVLYKSEHLWDTWQEGGPQGTRFNRNKSGWFDLPIFEDWFVTIALPYLKKQNGPRVMIGDNLSSHVSLRVIEECERNNISFILLPPNSTHLLQPLDVSFFRPLKTAWRAVLTEWKKYTRGTISKDAFPSLLKQTLTRISANSAENIKSGFRATGLVPFDPDHILRKLPDNEEGHQSNTEAWTLSFEEMLKEVRYPPNKPGSCRRRKLDVAPGKSIVGRDFQENENSAATSDCVSSTSESEDDPSPNEVLLLKEEAFIVADYKYTSGNKEHTRQYVGVVTNVGATEVSVKFLRPHENSRNVFVFPNVPDEDTIQKEQISRVLPTPVEKRGMFIFREDVF